MRGQAIYRTGVSPSGQPITAILSGGTEVQASIVPCVGCHGLDGQGRPESSVIPSNISWEELTRPYEVSTASGRRRTAYDDRLAIRAITLGIDASGNRLSAAMPHFAMSRSDAMDLVAYLKKISADRDPGISDLAVRIGVLLPPDITLTGQRAAIQNALSAYFEEWNGRGGVYNRHVELVFAELPPEPAKAASAYAEFLGREPVFALLNSFIAGAESEIVALLGQQKVPLIGAMTLLPPTTDNHAVFFVDSGLPGQVEALVEHALKEYGSVSPKPVVIASNDALSQAGVNALRAKLTGSQWSDLEELPAPRDAAGANELTRRLAARQIPVAFLLMRAGDLRMLIGSSQRTSWSPAFLIPGALSIPDTAILRSVVGPVVLAFPFSSADISQDARVEWNRLAGGHRLATQHIAAQFSALCEARILVEGLKRAGRDLSRERLLESLDGLYDFSCGFKQPVSLGSGRRFSIAGAHVLMLNPKTGELVDPDIARSLSRTSGNTSLPK
jgi:ABC-type branched-subunit amino acid transport system substrate-binding protein